MEVEFMPNASELVEKLARQLERSRVLSALKECKDMNDVKALIQKYEMLLQETDN